MLLGVFLGAVEGDGSIQDGDGTIGHGLTMHIVKGLSIREGACYTYMFVLPTLTKRLQNKKKKKKEKVHL